MPIVNGPVTRMLDGRKEEFEDLYYAQGKSIRDVARHFGISHNGLNRWMKASGYKARSWSEAASRRHHDSSDAVIRLRLKDRMSHADIAYCRGTTRSSVYSVLDSHGLAGPLETLPSYEEYIVIRMRLRDHMGHDKIAAACALPIGRVRALLASHRLLGPVETLPSYDDYVREHGCRLQESSK